MKLKTMLFMLFLLLTVIPLTVFEVTTITYYNDKMLKMLENDLKVATLTQVEAIQNFVNEREINVSTLCEYDSVYRLLEHPNPVGSLLSSDVTNMLISRVAKNENLVSASIIDKDFHVVASSAAFIANADSPLEDAKDSYLDGYLHFSPVVNSTTNGVEQRVMVISKGLFKNGELMGYFVEELNLKFFESVRAAVNLFNNGTIYLLDGNAGIITAGSATDSRDQYVLDIDERSGFKEEWKNRDKSQKSGVVKYKAQGEYYFSYYSQFDNVDWTMVSTVNVDKVLKTPLSYQSMILLILIILFLLVIAINYSISFSIVKPLENMISCFQKIKSMNDYSIRMDIAEKSEFGIIAQEINSLLANVETHLKMERQVQKRLREHARIDPLTGLYNKKAIEELICLKLDEANAEKRRIALIFIDVDDFKNYNTEYGHIGGDRILKFVAQKIKEEFSLAGRLGGDEFTACLFDNESVNSVEEIARGLIDILEEGIALEEGQTPIPVRCSIGIALSNSKTHNFHELLSKADGAMYRVKNTSKNDIIVHDDMAKFE